MDKNIQNIYNKYSKDYKDKILWVAEMDSDLLLNKRTFYIVFAPIEDDLYWIDYSILSNNKDLDEIKIDIRLLWELLKYDSDIGKNAILAPSKIINLEYQEQIKKLLDFKEIFILNKDNFEYQEQFKRYIKNIIVKTFKDNTKEKNFIKKLSNTELSLLKSICLDNNYKDEINITITGAIEKYNISRSVFISLFYKIKEFNIAEIDSRGVKGTHIKFNNIQVIKSLID